MNDIVAGTVQTIAYGRHNKRKTKQFPAIDPIGMFDPMCFTFFFRDKAKFSMRRQDPCLCIQWYGFQSIQGRRKHTDSQVHLSIQQKIYGLSFHSLHDIDIDRRVPCTEDR